MLIAVDSSKGNIFLYIRSHFDSRFVSGILAMMAVMALMHIILSAIKAAAGGALCAIAYTNNDGMGITTYSAMLLVLSLPHHPPIIVWDIRTLGAGAILSLLARLFYCTHFRKRLTTMLAGLASLYLFWPVWLSLYVISTQWRIFGYQCCTGKLQSSGSPKYYGTQPPKSLPLSKSKPPVGHHASQKIPYHTSPQDLKTHPYDCSLPVQ